jgi:hypothetical protein
VPADLTDWSASFMSHLREVAPRPSSSTLPGREPRC